MAIVERKAVGEKIEHLPRNNAFNQVKKYLLQVTSKILGPGFIHRFKNGLSPLEDNVHGVEKMTVNNNPNQPIERIIRSGQLIMNAHRDYPLIEENEFLRSQIRTCREVLVNENVESDIDLIASDTRTIPTNLIPKTSRIDSALFKDYGIVKIRRVEGNSLKNNINVLKMIGLARSAVLKVIKGWDIPFFDLEESDTRDNTTHIVVSLEKTDSEGNNRRSNEITWGGIRSIRIDAPSPKSLSKSIEANKIEESLKMIRKNNPNSLLFDELGDSAIVELAQKGDFDKVKRIFGVEKEDYDQSNYPSLMEQMIERLNKALQEQDQTKPINMLANLLFHGSLLNDTSKTSIGFNINERMVPPEILSDTQMKDILLASDQINDLTILEIASYTLAQNNNLTIMQFDESMYKRIKKKFGESSVSELAVMDQIRIDVETGEELRDPVYTIVMDTNIAIKNLIDSGETNKIDYALKLIQRVQEHGNIEVASVLQKYYSDNKKTAA